MPKNVVFIDNDLPGDSPASCPARYYRLSLELAGYNVKCMNSVDDLTDFLNQQPLPEMDIFITDVMMPRGRRYEQRETDNDIYTGLYVARDVRTLYPDVPIIIISVCSSLDFSAHASRVAQSLDLCIYLQKQKTTPFRLEDIVSRYFSEAKLEPTKKRGVFERLFNSLLLRPSVSGIGIDLKKLGGAAGDD